MFNLKNESCPAHDIATPGEVVTVTGRDFKPQSTVTVTLEVATGHELSLGTTLADSRGVITAELTAPQSVTQTTFMVVRAAGITADDKTLLGRSDFLSLMPAEPPCATPDLVTTTLNSMVEIPVLQNDLAGGNAIDPTTLTIIDESDDAQSVITTDWHVALTPHDGFFGVVSFGYRICDSQALCSDTIVEVNVDPECTIEGTIGSDILEGTAGDDVICGYGGDDIIVGLAGNDILLGGRGNDYLYGNHGDDQLYGHEGQNAAIGGAGTDTINIGEQALFIYDPADSTPPTIALELSTLATEIAISETVTVTFACDDPSGLQLCQGTLPDGSVLDTSVPGVFTFSVTAIDWAGNESSMSRSYRIGHTLYLPLTVSR